MKDNLIDNPVDVVVFLVRHALQTVVHQCVDLVGEEMLGILTGYTVSGRMRSSASLSAGGGPPKRSS